MSNRILNQVKCEQHLMRKVDEILDEYPSLNKKLQICVDKGANEVKLGTCYGKRIKPIIVKKNNSAIIYINQ